MPLPIPDILERAARVIELAAAYDKDPLSSTQAQLREALKVVSPKDLQAVMSEVGKVYTNVFQPRVLSFGSRANPDGKHLDLAVIMDFGFGPKPVITSLPIKDAEKLIQTFQEDMDQISPKKGGLILHSEDANGKPN